MVVVLRFPSLELVEKVYSYGPVYMPYVPGFLSFREAPNVIHAFAKLEKKPDVIMVDGTLPYVFFLRLSDLSVTPAIPTSEDHLWTDEARKGTFLAT